MEASIRELAADDHLGDILAVRRYPPLLDMLSVEVLIVTIDATGCQRHIAQKIVSKGRLRARAETQQGSLREDVELFIAEQKVAVSKTPRSVVIKPVDGVAFWECDSD
jgi:hypothetical protein